MLRSEYFLETSASLCDVRIQDFAIRISVARDERVVIRLHLVVFVVRNDWGERGNDGLVLPEQAINRILRRHRVAIDHQ